MCHNIGEIENSNMVFEHVSNGFKCDIKEYLVNRTSVASEMHIVASSAQAFKLDQPPSCSVVILMLILCVVSN